MLNVDKEKLRNAYKKSSTAEVVTLSLAMRDRPRTHTNIVAYRRKLSKTGEKININDYQAFWKDLEEAKVGEVVYGKRGAFKGFNWFFNLIEIAEIASGYSKIKKTPLDKPVLKEDRADNFVKSHNMHHGIEIHEEVHHDSTKLFIPLRKDFDLIISMPSNLTSKEKDSILTAISKAV